MHSLSKKKLSEIVSVLTIHMEFTATTQQEFPHYNWSEHICRIRRCHDYNYWKM